MDRRLLTILFVSSMVLGLVEAVLAITAPTTGSFAYDLYDITVNKILKGPIGFIAGVVAIVFGATQVITARILPAVAAILGGAAILKADAITKTLGLTL